ncbi:hypothetical protein LLG46_06555 [bacterium]|nr:hypothetical protein [bacterium]
MKTKNGLTMLVMAATLITAAASPAITATLGTKVIKGAAIGFAVTKAAGPLDKFINTVTFRHGMKSKLATKVVPILSVGEKGYIGGAQVSGPKAKVDSVKAVFQYEKNLSNNNYRAKVLLPSASLNPVKLNRVAGVGVTAIIDVALDGRLKYNTVGTGIQAGDVIRGAAVLVAVKNAGSTINKALNTITFNKGSVTKVVPMGSVGEKAYLGAAQISASSKVIGSVNALWQYEDLFSGGKFRVKILVPTTSSNPLKMKRVDGAGVTAVVDMALSEQKDVTSKNNSRPTVKEILKSRVTNSEKTNNDNGKHKGWYKGEPNGPKPFVDGDKNK